MGGFPNLPPDWPVQQWGDWDGTIARICALPLEFEPGTALHYHALTAHWIMAEIVRRLDGAKRSYAEICADEVYRPLKMKDSHLGVRPDMRERLVALRALDAESIPFPFSMLEDFDLAAGPGGRNSRGRVALDDLRSRALLSDVAERRRARRRAFTVARHGAARYHDPHRRPRGPSPRVAARDERLAAHSGESRPRLVDPRYGYLSELLRIARLSRARSGTREPRASWLGPIPLASSCSSA